MGIANIINNSTTTSGGEIIRELVNSSDGAGLHFESGGYIELANSAAAEFGTSDFSVEFVLNQKEANVSSNNIFRYPSSGDNRMFIQHQSGTTKITFRDTSDAVYDLGYDMAADYGTPTHYVLTADRDGNALLYKNGNQVGSVDISASSSVNIGSGNTGVGAIGSSSANYTMLGTFYRFRTWNKALTSTEVQTAFERADVDYSSQYGSQTERVNNGGFDSATTNWTGVSSSIASVSGGQSGNCLQLTRVSGSTQYAYQLSTAFSTNFVAGKKYRLTAYVKSGTSGNESFALAALDFGTAIEEQTTGTTTGSWVQHELVFTATANTDAIAVYKNSATAGTMLFDTVSLVQIGAVSDYDLAFANENQSRMVADRSTNNVDGEMSSSGVKQTQVIKQLNSTAMRVGGTSATAATPADGDIIVSGGVGVGAAAGAGGHGLTVDKVVNDDWVAKIKNSGNTTPYGLQVDCQGSNAVTAFAVYAGSAPNNTSFTIKPSGVVVQGGDVKIGNSSAADTQLSVECDTTGEAIGDGIRVQNAHGVNADIAPMYFGVHGGTRRAKAAIGLKRTGSYGIGELRFAVDSNGDDADVSFANDTKLTIDASGKTTANALKVLDPTHGRYFDFVLDSSASYLDVSHALNLRVNGASSLATALAIDSSANVTVSGPKLEVTDDLASAHTILKLKNTNAAAGYGSQIQLEDHDSKYYISIVDSDLKFFNGATTTVNFANSGLASFSGGIAFPAPTPASAGTPAASSVLDVYEEGTFLPNVGGNATYTSREGRYTRVGRLVTCTFDMTINAIGTGSTNVVSGLPFATGDSIGAGGNVNYYSGLALSPVLFAPTVSGSGVQIRSATSAATSPSNHAIFANGARVACVVTYTV